MVVWTGLHGKGLRMDGRWRVLWVADDTRELACEENGARNVTGCKEYRTVGREIIICFEISMTHAEAEHERKTREKS
jgi:hypothetical protein